MSERFAITQTGYLRNAGIRNPEIRGLAVVTIDDN
jgi:hypothetical protein